MSSGEVYSRAMLIEKQRNLVSITIERFELAIEKTDT